MERKALSAIDAEYAGTGNRYPGIYLPVYLYFYLFIYLSINLSLSTSIYCIYWRVSSVKVRAMLCVSTVHVRGSGNQGHGARPRAAPPPGPATRSRYITTEYSPAEATNW